MVRTNDNLTKAGSGNSIATTSKRRKTKPKKRTSYSFFVLLVTVIGTVLISLFTPIFNISAISVTGNSKLKTEDIITASGLRYGTNIFRTKMSGAAKVLKSIPYVEEISVSRSLPGTVKINITERKPVGYVRFMGSYICLDGNGYVLEVLPNIGEQKLPVITGITFNQFNLGEKLTVDSEQKLELIVSCVKEIIQQDMLEVVSEINVEDIDNVHLKINGQMQVVVGDGLRLSYKMNFLKQVVNDLGEDKKGYVDLRNEGRVTYRANP